MNQTIHHYSKITEKRDIRLDGKTQTVRVLPVVWDAFTAFAEQDGLTISDAASQARKLSNESLAEGIHKWMEAKGATVHTVRTGEDWMSHAVELLRPIFKERGYPIDGAVVTAKIAIPAKGARGKTIADFWSKTLSEDGETFHIHVKPSEGKALRILSSLVHELCHLADELRNGGPLSSAQGHGKHFKAIGTALDLEGKAPSMAGGEAFAVWAGELLEILGPLPHSAYSLPEANKKKQATRMLKFEHELCPADPDGISIVWRMSSKGVSAKARVSCPCCGEQLENPHYEGGEDEEGEEEAQAKYDRHDYPERTGKPAGRAGRAKAGVEKVASVRTKGRSRRETNVIEKIGGQVKKAASRRQGD